MRTKGLIKSAVEHARASASVKTVYGEPVQVDGKTVIPVARVGYGFKQESGSGAGAVSAKPVGVVEISGDETRFVPVAQTKKFAIIAAIGSGVGLVFGWLLGRGGTKSQG